MHNVFPAREDGREFDTLFGRLKDKRKNLLNILEWLLRILEFWNSFWPQTYTTKTYHNNRRTTVFNFKFISQKRVILYKLLTSSSSSEQIKHIPNGSSILVNNLRECPLNSRKRPNRCRSPTCRRETADVNTCNSVPLLCCAVASRSRFLSGMVGARLGRGIGTALLVWHKHDRTVQIKWERHI
jgi:hypothetical protein